MAVLIEHVRQFLIDEGIVRAPNVAGPGARPWLPPAWKHPDGGPVGPGDAAQGDFDDVAHDDGIVVSLMRTAGVPPVAGEEDLRYDEVDIHLRGDNVPGLDALEGEIRTALLGDPPQPGGKTDWVMAGLYVIQARQSKPYQPIFAEGGTFAFMVGYQLVVRAV